MQTIHGFIVTLHILTGALSLLLFWVPSLTKKGGKSHKQFGGYYIKAMLFTSISGVISSTMVLFIPLVIYPTMPEHFESVAYFTAYLRGQYLFLLMLSLLVWNNVRHSVAALKAKQNLEKLRTVEYLWLPALLTVVASIALYQGITYGITLTCIFAPIALLNAIGIARYVYQKNIVAGSWVTEHIGHIIGSGIGAYTAFFAFGGRALFEGSPSLQIASWILPALIGVPFSVWLNCKYKPKSSSLKRPSLKPTAVKS
ncbi:hypothetical protein ACYTPF_13105 [Alteromonas sp. HB246098]